MSIRAFATYLEDGTFFQVNYNREKDLFLSFNRAEEKQILISHLNSNDLRLIAELLRLTQIEVEAGRI